MTGIRIENERELVDAMRKYAKQAEIGLEEAVRMTAMGVEGEAIKSIQRGSKSGKVYTHYLVTNKKTGGVFPGKKRNKPHQASAPGESPATDSGNLVSRIRSVYQGLTAYVGTDEDYGGYLEFGTTKIKARPWLRPAREKMKKKFNQMAINAFKRIN